MLWAEQPVSLWALEGASGLENCGAPTRSDQIKGLWACSDIKDIKDTEGSTGLHVKDVKTVKVKDVKTVKETKSSQCNKEAHQSLQAHSEATLREETA